MALAACSRERTSAKRNSDRRNDPLTGLANRGAFYEQVASELVRCQRYGHPFTIAYLDCDDFKAINDRFGHQTGDALLCAVATILQRADVCGEAQRQECGASRCD